jgi:hypothetical protein
MNVNFKYERIYNINYNKYYMKNKLSYTVLIKLDESDKKIAKDLREHGINLTQFFRLSIREAHKKMILENEKNM